MKGNCKQTDVLISHIILSLKYKRTEKYVKYLRHFATCNWL